MSESVALVTGGSSGIGLCTAEALRAAGCRVYILSRREFKREGLTHLCADVTCEDEVRRAVDSLLDREGRLDILVNCAGFGISGAIEFTELSDAKRQMDVNFFGMVNVTRAVLPHMRRRGSGRIVNISSVAACAAIPFQAYYSASKAAINAYTLALTNEVRPYASASRRSSPATSGPDSPMHGQNPRQVTRNTVVGSRAAWPKWSTMSAPACPRKRRAPMWQKLPCGRA